MPEEFRKQLNRVTLAAMLGPALEWYDFFIAASAAAIVWPAIYFQFLPPGYAFALSIIAYGIIFIARPIGAYVFGAYGDRVGRKATLLLTITTIALSVLAIGLTPDYKAIGIAAPILINVFRFTQGIGLGGEFGSASSWVMEFAAAVGSKRRGFRAGLTYATLGIGQACAIAMMLLVSSIFPTPQFLSYGWRIPFIIGAVVLGATGVVRYFTKESPIFLKLKELRAQQKVAAVQRPKTKEVVAREWKKTLVISVSWFQSNIVNVVMNPFMIGYLIVRGVGANTALLYALIGAGTIGSLVPIFSAYCSDIIGRRKIAIIGATYTLVMLYPTFTLISTLNPVFVTLGLGLLVFGAFFAGGACPAWYSELYPTAYRVTGTGIAWQFGNLGGGLIGTFLFPYLAALYGGPVASLPYLLIATTIVCACSLLANLKLPETISKEIKADA
jgi:MFS family permease